MAKVILIIGLFTFFQIGMNSCDFAPGSYPYAETYKLKIKESDLITIVKKFKEENPGFCVPKEVPLSDGRKGENDYWYHIWFYYKYDNQIINTWIRQLDKENTTFAFVGVNDGLNLGNWKLVNKSFSSKENEQQKAKFEKQILNKIKAILK